MLWRRELRLNLYLIRNSLPLHLPFSDMEDSGSSHRHRDQSGFSTRRYSGTSARRQTRLRDILQTPVPVIIVIRAKLRGAFPQFIPRDAIKRHAHVMFTGYPRRHFRLSRQNKGNDDSDFVTLFVSSYITYSSTEGTNPYYIVSTTKAIN